MTTVSEPAPAEAAAPPPDPGDPQYVRSATGLLRGFNEAGVLAAADVHVATALGRLCGERDETVLLAAALAVRAPTFGHVFADLASVRQTVVVDADVAVDVAALGWPDAAAWLERVAASPLVRRGDEDRPLVLDGSRLYLDRYHRYEQRVVTALSARAGALAEGVDPALLRDGLERLFPRDADGERPDRQRLAAATAVLRRLSVVAGGPGTGKTRTLARILALVVEQATAAGRPPPRVALAAPTGKAADRMQASVRAAAADPGLAVDDEVRDRVASAEASTIHRLLGWKPGSETRFRFDRDRPLPDDVVVIDETSMVSLALMAKLLDAVRPQARVVLVGDPRQLASVEAGAVLGDVVGPATDDWVLSAPARALLADVTGDAIDGGRSDGPALADGMVVLRRVFRFGERSGIAALARAIEAGEADAALAALDGGSADVDRVEWTAGDHPATGAMPAGLAGVRAAVVGAGRRLHAAAAAGDEAGVLAVRDDLRVLCAHRRGPAGVTAWVPLVERWLAEDVAGYDPTARWYVGRPVLVTANDYQLGLYNGDAGVVVALPDDGGLTVVFDAGGAQPRRVSPHRLEHIETVHAMTVHKSQGSQFRHVVVVLPDRTSRILTRELLYTAVTRAEERLTVVGSADAVRAAVTRPIQRASGLRDALWG